MVKETNNKTRESRKELTPSISKRRDASQSVSRNSMARDVLSSAIANRNPHFQPTQNRNKENDGTETHVPSRNADNSNSPDSDASLDVSIKVIIESQIQFCNKTSSNEMIVFDYRH